MLSKSNKNSGMSLIEVIVSMLVLSIAVVAVTMSFSTASKINMGTGQKQTAESLMENLLEYAEAGGTEYFTWFGADSSEVLTDGVLPSQQKTLYKGVKQGMHVYDVRVLVDNNPTEYANDKLNDYDVIQFGGASSNTILIDASLGSYNVKNPTEQVSDYDEDAYEYFYNTHISAVLEANLAGATPPLTPTPMSQIPNYVDRELRLVVSKPVENKMQLTAKMTYILDDGIMISAGASDTFETTLFVSDLYDLASDTDEDAKKLNQIYIMYSPAKLETVGYNLGQDIRVMDPNKVMDADIFIANQQTSLEDVDLAIGKNEITQRDTSTHTVFVSCSNPDGSGSSMQPAGGDIYCSGLLAIQGFDTTTTTGHQQRMLAKGKEVRIIATTLEVLEAGTDTVLASKTITHLQ